MATDIINGTMMQQKLYLEDVVSFNINPNQLVILSPEDFYIAKH